MLVVRGEAGAGKTALLDDAEARAARPHGRCARVAPTPSRRAPFAGLAELCAAAARSAAGDCPPARAAALAVRARGWSRRRAPSIATRSTRLRWTCSRRWRRRRRSSRSSTTRTCSTRRRARRSRSSPRAYGSTGSRSLIATESDDGFPDAEEMRLGGLDPAHARSLLCGAVRRRAGAAPWSSGSSTAARATRWRSWRSRAASRPQQRAASAPLDGSLPPSAEWAYLRRIEALPRDTRRALLVAALAATAATCEPSHGHAPALGLDPTRARARGAGRARIAWTATRVTFCHELARTAVSYSALTAERRLAHGALAGAVEGEQGLWHQAQRGSRPDDAVAEGLETWPRAPPPRRLRGRGAGARAGRAFDVRSRPPRGAAARAARCGHLAGHVHAALDHCGAGAGVRRRAGAADRAGTHARPDRRAQRQRRACAGLAHGGRRALRARRSRQGGRDARRRRASGAAGRLSGRCGPARPPRPSASPGRRRRVSRRTLHAGHRAAVRRRARRGVALHRARRTPRPSRRCSRIPTLGAALALAGRYARAREVLGRLIAEARNAGAVDMLPYALVRLAGVELDTRPLARRGGCARPRRSSSRRRPATAPTTGLALGTLAWLEAARGHAEACRAHVEEALELAGRLGSRVAARPRRGSALGVLELGRGRPEAAIAATARTCGASSTSRLVRRGAHSTPAART